MPNPAVVSGGALDDGSLAATSAQSLAARSDTENKARSSSRAEFVRRLLDLGRRHGDIPIYGSPEWEQLDVGDPRRFASVVRAAECWRRDGEPGAIREQLERELAENDLLARWRVRQAGLDVHGGTDWAAVANRAPIAVLRRLRTYEPEAVA
jgi:Protein of unknown function (DUF2742)